MKRTLQAFSAASILLLIACATQSPSGHLKEDESISSIKPGVTSKSDMVKLMGSPSSESTFGPSTWYYISSIHESRSVFPTKVVDQHVIEVAFDSGNLVTNVKEYGMSDGKKVELASRTTPTEGQKLGFFEQILGNLGRFNKGADNAVSNDHSHRTNAPGSQYPR